MKEEKSKTQSIESSLLSDIRRLLAEARTKVYRVANSAMVVTNWHIGRMIVEAQGGEERAAYGDGLLKNISKQLTAEYGKGFTLTNLKYMRQFYLYFPKGHTLCDKLSWSHYRLLLKVSNPKAREYYAEEAAKAPWSVRQLERQINTQYYERLLSTHRDESEIKKLIAENLPKKPEKFDPLTLIHDPFMLEFIGAKPDPSWNESKLQKALLDHLQEFLLELGRGFAFMGRQKRITIDGLHFYPDLVFYNAITKSYVIIDLKIGRADYSDVGQMQLYVNYYNMEVCRDDDNPTVGIILCAEKNDAVIRYTLGDRKDIGVFQAKYDLVLPTPEELQREIERTREQFLLLNGNEE